MTTTLINPSDGPIPVPSTFLNSTFAPVIAALNDTIAAADQVLTQNSNGIIQLPSATILGLAQLMSSTFANSNEQNWLEQVNNPKSLMGFYLNNILTLTNLTQLLSEIPAIVSSMTTVNSTDNGYVSSLNGALHNYNGGTGTGTLGGDQGAVNTLNSAIAQYNGGTLTLAQYNSAVNTYNNYIAARNTSSTIANTDTAINTFNNNILGVNSQIASVNNKLSATGISGFSPQDSETNGPATLTSQPLSTHTPPPNVPSLNVPAAIPTATNTISPPVSNLQQTVNTLINDLLIQTLAKTTQTTQRLNSQSDYIGFLQFFLQGTIAALPAAYYKPLPNVFLGATGGVGSGGGVGLGTLIVGLSNPQMAGILATSIFSTLNQKIGQPGEVGTVNQVAFLALSLLSQVGLAAADPALHLLLARLPTVADQATPVAAALGLAFASQVAFLTKSNNIDQALQGILSNAFPGISANNLNDLVAALSSSLKVFFLQTGLSALSQSIGLPKLTAQVVGTTTAGASLLANIPPQSNTSDVLQNTISLAAVKANLASSLVQQDAANSANVADIVNQSISDDFVRSQNISQDDLRDRVTQSLINQGIQKEAAITSANNTVAFVNAEIQGGALLDTGVHTDNLDRDQLTESLKAAGIKSNIATSIVSNAAVNTEETTFRDLRDNISAGLVSRAGLSSSAAIGLATKTVIPNTPTFTVSPTTLLAINDQVSSATTAALSGLGTGSAQTIGNQSTTVINSIQAQLETHLTNLKSIQTQGTNNIQTTNLLDDNTRGFLKPTFDLYTFNQRLLDPANNLIMSAATGVMYQRSEPTNFQKSIQFV